MSSRAQKDKGQKQNSNQAILSELLKEEENRYCSDCGAKGNMEFTVFVRLPLQVLLFCLIHRTSWWLIFLASTTTGPRWASWNLGVFLCIRCAGIHRNLGVHISRVKSVNLDSWTPEQMEVSCSVCVFDLSGREFCSHSGFAFFGIQSIQQWGNKRAAEFWECYLPSDFRRPQTDSYHSNMYTG